MPGSPTPSKPRSSAISRSCRAPEIAGASWRDYGAIILVPTLKAALPLVDRLAPEHLEIMARDAEALGDEVNNAGAIFLGAYTPEAIGDYVGGSNHVLPTARSARFSSGLGVLDFVKRTSLLHCDARSLAGLGPSAVALGEAEGLDAHARSVALRLARGTAVRDLAMSRIEPERRDRLAEVVLDEATIPRGTPIRITNAPSRSSISSRRIPSALKERDDGPYSAPHLAAGIEADLRRADAGGEPANPFRGVDDAVPTAAQGLFSGLRDLLLRDPHREPAPDRGDRPRTHQTAQRGRRR